MRSFEKGCKILEKMKQKIQIWIKIFKIEANISKKTQNWLERDAKFPTMSEILINLNIKQLLLKRSKNSKIHAKFNNEPKKLKIEAKFLKKRCKNL